MSQYLNKIGLLKYNNSTYKPVGSPQYYSVRDPGLVSSDPRINFFNYPWKSDDHWSYTNYGQGWYYNGKDEISYTVDIPSTNISCINSTDDSIIPSGLLYNVIPINSELLKNISSHVVESKFFYDPQQMFLFKPFDSEDLLSVVWNNDYRAYGDQNDPATYTYFIISGTENINLVLNWGPPQNMVDGRLHSTEPPYVSGYWTNTQTPICGILCACPFLQQGNINDIYSNQLSFKVKSPNIKQQPQSLISSNLVEGLFYSVPGTDYITGICTTKMYFLNNQYVYMRGLFKGNIEIQDGIYQNEIVAPSTIIKKVKVKNLQGILKNITDLPEEIKYGLDYYYAWGWLYGIDNIKYKNIWYKKEISGDLSSSNNKTGDIYFNRYIGTLSTNIVTNNGKQEIINKLTGNFSKEIQSNIITGYLEGKIKAEPFDILMKGYVTGYYETVTDDVIRPIQISGILYNKSVIGNELRQILDIKYANTLGRKELTYNDSLYGQNLQFVTKNYDPYNKPYMLQTWKIIEYQMSTDERDYINEVPNHTYVDLNTYIADKNKIQKYYKSRIVKSNQQLSALPAQSWEVEYYGQNLIYVSWSKNEDNDFVIKCSIGTVSEDTAAIPFNTLIDAQKYIKHLCGVSNLKLKQIKNQGDTITYVLDSSNLEIQ